MKTLCSVVDTKMACEVTTRSHSWCGKRYQWRFREQLELIYAQMLLIWRIWCGATTRWHSCSFPISYLCIQLVISLVGAQKTTLYPDHIFLLLNSTRSSEPFRIVCSVCPIARICRRSDFVQYKSMGSYMLNYISASVSDVIVNNHSAVFLVN